MGATRPPLDYLAHCSQESLESVELSRLNLAANLRKEFQEILNEWIESEVDARLARTILDWRRKHHHPRESEPGNPPALAVAVPSDPRHLRQSGQLTIPFPPPFPPMSADTSEASTASTEKESSPPARTAGTDPGSLPEGKPPRRRLAPSFSLARSVALNDGVDVPNDRPRDGTLRLEERLSTKSPAHVSRMNMGSTNRVRSGVVKLAARSRARSGAVRILGFAPIAATEACASSLASVKQLA